MEIMVVLGVVLAFASLITGFLMEGGTISALVAPSAALIIFGGTIGASIVAFSTEEVLAIPKYFKIMLTQKLPNELEVVKQIVTLSQKARREGLLALENDLPNIKDDFLRRGLQLIVDGTDPELFRSILENEIYAIAERHRAGAEFFEAAGGYAPTMGIIGTVMGLVHVLGQLSTPDKLGPAIAMAFTATLYGVSSANILWLPFSAKLKNLSKKELLIREMMLEGLVSLQEGHNPLLIEEKLRSFLKPKLREQNLKEGKGELNEAASA
ncbi:flagellar motor protein [Carboxydothermus pertinax]|uniref:Flagellar motor protein MotA n=1 Tax=Carboxydothermus pertinax TaxID=870242 RepID=A0A1L8CUE2_9THEO|nr:flagellar motor protein [Carboxydothermus pertinax]GAV22528.1 flagellar motor protein MotA [Carboxydothermus pertinax]